MRVLLLIIIASISFSAESFIEKPASIDGLYSFLGLVQYNIEYQNDTGFKKITASLQEYTRGKNGKLELKETIAKVSAETLAINRTIPVSIIYGDGHLAFNLGNTFSKMKIDKNILDKYTCRFTDPCKMGGYEILWNRFKDDHTTTDNIDDLVDFIAVEVVSE